MSHIIHMRATVVSVDIGGCLVAHARQSPQSLSLSLSLFLSLYQDSPLHTLPISTLTVAIVVCARVRKRPIVFMRARAHMQSRLHSRLHLRLHSRLHSHLDSVRSKLLCSVITIQMDRSATSVTTLHCMILFTTCLALNTPLAPHLLPHLPFLWTDHFKRQQPIF